MSAEVIRLPVETQTEDRSELLFGIAARAAEHPGEFERVLVIAACHDGQPLVWSRGMNLLELAGLSDLARASFVAEAQRQ